MGPAGDRNYLVRNPDPISGGSEFTPLYKHGHLFSFSEDIERSEIDSAIAIYTGSRKYPLLNSNHLKVKKSDQS